ncbi:MAG: MarR family winged helix-turn-helix transcriptional regulator [Pseudomonadota bacterium]
MRILVAFVTVFFVTIKPMTQWLENFLPYRLNRLSEAVSQSVRPIYQDMLGLTRPEWRVLAALADIGPATATELGAHSAQHKTKVSRAVFRLETRRWLSRTTDPDDRRSEILTLTPLGRNAYADLIGPLSAREAALMDKLSPEDRAALLQGLRALEAVLISR